MTSPWKDAYLELEVTIHDLPRMLNVLRCVHECGDLFGEDEGLQAMTLALDQAYDRMVKFADTYQRLFDEARREDGLVVPLHPAADLDLDLDLAASG
jgi:hypothetical protein